MSKKFKKNSTVLIPEYICNVVDKSFDDSYKIIRYKLDENFEPDMDVLLGLLASLYGSGCFMNSLNNEGSKLYEIIKKRKIEVVIDFAQDFYQIYKILTNNCNYHYVFSFNDKSFMGAMGGIIISNVNFSDDTEKKKLGMKKNIILVKRYFFKFLFCKVPYFKRLRDKRRINLPREDSFEFSYCNVFPYTYDNYRISNFQVFLALLGVFRLKNYKKKKRKFIENNFNYINKTKLIDTSTYLSFNKVVESNENKIKKTYGCFNNKYKSIYPDLKIIHNKGFCDK